MGKLFVIDGTDGSGKETQFKELQKRLNEKGIDYKTVSFPNYGNPSSALVEEYLSGKFGENAQEISPYIASTFFAVDRCATYKLEYKDYYENGGIILADRYTTANMVHQAGKIKDEKERNKFMDWLLDLEFNKLELPSPSEVFFLDMPLAYSMQLMENRKNKFTHEEKKDIHESNPKHLKDAYEAACSLAEKYGWHRIQCVENEKIRTIEDINNEIFEKVYSEICRDL